MTRYSPKAAASARRGPRQPGWVPDEEQRFRAAIKVGGRAWNRYYAGLMARCRKAEADNAAAAREERATDLLNAARDRMRALRARRRQEVGVTPDAR